MEDKNKDFALPENDFLAEEPPLEEEFFELMPNLELAASEAPKAPAAEAQDEEFVWPDVLLPASRVSDETQVFIPASGLTAEADEAVVLQEEMPQEMFFQEQPVINEIGADEQALSDHDLTRPGESRQEFAEDIYRDEAYRVTGEDAAEFRAAFTVPEQTEETYVPSGKVRPPRKGRPKRKKGYGLFGIPHILATVVWLAIILVIGTTLGRFLWVCAADVLAFGRESNKVSVTITSNDSIDDIAEKLHDAGLVRYPELFKLYADIAVDEGDIIPGTFEMDTLYDYHALVVQMGPRSSNRAVIEDVLIPEGYNCRQIFALLEDKGICTVEELEAYAANGEFADFWFLEGVERGDKYCLEGFLFPDTYDFYANSTPREALGKLLLGFEHRFTEEIYAQLPALNERLSAMMRSNGCSEEHIANNQLDLRDLLTVASLIEEETSSALESPTIASVIYNRYTQDLVYERYLGIDAALIYESGDASNIDTSLDSPYNTYTNAGLTPGPISNPGLDSINAALNPAQTNYYYYVLNPETYVHDFSVTLEEHEKKVEKYKAMTAEEEE